LVALGPDRNAIGDRLFLCHGIHSFTGCVRIRTALPLTGQFVDELDSNPTSSHHTGHGGVVEARAGNPGELERAAIAHLSKLSDRELKDIGLHRSQIPAAVRGDATSLRMSVHHY
jgi:hypothetical protein